MTGVDDWNPVLLREKVRSQAKEIEEAKRLIKLGLSELTNDRVDGTWEDTVGQLRDYLEKPLKKSA